MALGSWKGPSFSKARVDSAESGNQEEASLFWTSASLAAKPAAPTASSSHTTRTTHLVTRPVKVPAISRLMAVIRADPGDVPHPELP